MTERARIFQEREWQKKWLCLNFFCHEGESISIREIILRESWITTMLEALAAAGKESDRDVARKKLKVYRPWKDEKK